MDSEDDYEVIEQEDGELIPISGPELVELDSDTFSTDDSMEEMESDTDTVCDTEDFPWHISDKEMERQRIALEHYNLLWFGEKYPDVNLTWIFTMLLVRRNTIKAKGNPKGSPKGSGHILQL